MTNYTQFYHEGFLKEAFEVIVSFILLCAPIVAFGAHLIEFGGVTASHNTWFLVVTLSVMMAYDLQRLHSFNINVLGAQLTMKERLIAAPPLDRDVGQTPSFYRKQPLKSQAKSSSYRPPRGRANSDGDYERLDDEEEVLNLPIDSVPALTFKGSKSSLESIGLDSAKPDGDAQDEAMSYLVFKRFSFRMDDKKQQLLVCSIWNHASKCSVSTFP